MKLCAVDISRLFITAFLSFSVFCEAKSHLKGSDSKELLNGLSSLATADEGLEHGSTVDVQNSQEKVSNLSVESFTFLVNLLEKKDKEFILTHLATLPSSEIRSMENELAGMSESDVEGVIQEMLFKGQQKEKWPWSCKRTLNNCAGCTQSCQCKSGRCNWRFVCSNKNDKGYNGCTCAFDHDCSSGRCASNLKCANKLDFGKSCGEDDDCKSGVCSWGFKCVGPGNNGSYCFEDDDCHSGRCSKYLKCAPKLDEFEVCWKGGNDCKRGSKCISVASVGTGVCVRDQTMGCLYEAGKSVPSSLKHEGKKIANSLTGTSKAAQGQKVLTSLKKLESEFKGVLNTAAACLISKDENSFADTSEGQLYDELIKADPDENFEKLLKVLPSVVFMLSADAAYVVGAEIEMGMVVGPLYKDEHGQYKPAMFLVADICGSAGFDFGADAGIEVGIGFFETPDDVGGFTNCISAEVTLGGGGGGFVCGSIINQIFGLGKWNWEVGASVGFGGGAGINFALGCHSFKLQIQ